LFKIGRTQVKLQMSEHGLGQSGRSMAGIYRNTLEQTNLIPEMVTRTCFDARNGLVLKHLFAGGWFKTHHAFICSTAPSGMTPEQKKEYRLFTDTESMSVQMFSAEDNNVTLDTAFVAGKKTPDSERHDLATIRAMAATCGIELPPGDGTDMLQHIFLIPKSEIASIDDFVEWFDDTAGGTFYGQAKPREDYKAYGEMCLERSESFTDIVADIKTQLISEAHTFKTPLEAIMRLDELSELHSVRRATLDVTIDQAVFGKVAARHIEDARFFISIGDHERANQSYQKAVETAESGSCPLRRDQVTGGDSSGSDGSGTSQETTRKVWMSCPHCKRKQLEDPCAAKLFCGDCTALVNNGKVISTGNGGAQARREERTRNAAYLMQLVLQPASGSQSHALASKQHARV
jgi:hypothetical protein